MAEQGDEELQRYLGGMSFKLKRELATVIKQQADELAAAIKGAAPVRTGRLRDSVQVRRGRNTLELVVTAGGDATTTAYDRSATYRREVRIGSGDTAGIARATPGAGVTYDYSRAVEFGTEHQAAQPFFWPTYRARRDDIKRAIADAVDRALKG
jgi:HK97 gp10 family phage protein